MESGCVTIKNYRINPEQKAFIREKIDFLARRCPSNALISLAGDWTDKGFTGRLSVTSGRKNFYAAAEEQTLKLFIKSLCKKTLQQVRRWKKIRTYEEITGIINLNDYRTGLLAGGGGRSAGRRKGDPAVAEYGFPGGTDSKKDKANSSAVAESA